MNNDKRKTAARVALDGYLTSHHKRTTTERLTILDAVAGFKRPFTAVDLAHRLSDSGFMVSRGTLYNCLNLYLEAGIVSRCLGQGGNAGDTWQLSVNHTVTLSLVCSKCGRRRTVVDEALAALLADKRYPSFVPTATEIQVTGVCSRCKKKNK